MHSGTGRAAAHWTSAAAAMAKGRRVPWRTLAIKNSQDPSKIFGKQWKTHRLYVYIISILYIYIYILTIYIYIYIYHTHIYIYIHICLFILCKL